jgi:hypothetical protein
VACNLCDDTGWVCEDHGDRPLKADSKRPDVCPFGVGIPCPRCNRDSRHVAHVPRLPLGMQVALDRKQGGPATSPLVKLRKNRSAKQNNDGAVWEEKARPHTPR